MKETSITTRSNGPPSATGSAVLMFVRSSTLTRSSFLSDHASWPYPTSTALTRAAPRWRRQSVKPPVDAPTSSAAAPPGSIPKVSSAPESFSPPRDTKRGPSVTSIDAPSRTAAPALLTRCPSTDTLPARTAARACSLDGARPRLTSSTSILRVAICMSAPGVTDGVEPSEHRGPHALRCETHLGHQLRHVPVRHKTVRHRQAQYRNLEA